MSKKRAVATLFLPLLLASFLQSQSLAELAKKEKERRAALKGKSAPTVTTADLAKVKKRPAVEAKEQEPVAEMQAGPAGQAEAQGQPEGEPAAEAAAGAGQEQVKAAGEVEKPAEEPSPGEAPAMSAQDIQKRQIELADISQQKIEMVELLTLKMNALYQEFQSLDNLKSRETIQLQISDTYDKLLKAEAESAKAKKDLEDFMAQAKKDQAQSIWIK